MAEETKVWIQFQDECPRLGSGRRIVTVKKGRKWVHLRDVMGRTAKMTHGQYEALNPATLDTPLL